MAFSLCKICNKSFNVESGRFNRHLETDHKMTVKDYVIITEYNNVTPKCNCGFCEEEPNFRRGKFSKYAIGHEKYEYRQSQWIKKYGIPTCKTCGNEVKFGRGIPNTYCSFKCFPSFWNQEKVRKTVNERYGVDNVFQLQEVKDKSNLKIDKKANTKKAISTKMIAYGNKMGDLEKMKATMRFNHGVEHYSKTPKFRKDASERLKKDNPMYDDITAQKASDTYTERVLNGTIQLFKTKKYKDTNLNYQSSYEKEFLEICEAKGILSCIENGHSYKYLDKMHGRNLITDFSYQNYEIEIKSSWILEKQGGIEKIEAKRSTVENSGKNYILILDKNYQEFLEII